MKNFSYFHWKSFNFLLYIQRKSQIIYPICYIHSLKRAWLILTSAQVKIQAEEKSHNLVDKNCVICEFTIENI